MQPVPLNEAQLTLIRLFSRKMEQEEFQALQKILLSFYDDALQKELDRVIAQKNIQPEDFETRLELQQRTLP
ncbi:MAG TPA: hypothetical protein PLZ12_03400 [Saprospiraceae bacterium]|nr:hypothetical protein [Saprospiraceae bacterium]HRK80460.1 hypothetical protein [Saprospiraceae bacterium]